MALQLHRVALVASAEIVSGGFVVRACGLFVLVLPLLSLPAVAEVDYQKSAPAYAAPYEAPPPPQQGNAGGYEPSSYSRRRAGDPVPGLTPEELALFNSGLEAFSQARSVQGPKSGLGPRFNSDSCLSCHAYPTVGGSSPPINPLYVVANRFGANNIVPFFMQPNGPIREARRKYHENANGQLTKIPDGGVVNLFTISGRKDAPGCRLVQPDFMRSASYDNLVFRIPTPIYGAGLIEAISDNAIRTSFYSTAKLRRQFGVYGEANTNSSDGTINRFGWKAQVGSLLHFSGEAYAVEMGVTNELFPISRESEDRCSYSATIEAGPKVKPNAYGPSTDISELAAYMRLTAPPQALPLTPEAARGRALFDRVGCVACHTPGLPLSHSYVEAINREKIAYLYSDLMVHRMGWRLADGIYQGSAGPDQWRTAPLWGVGERLFFLHDGRAKSLGEAIEFHYSAPRGNYPASEANISVGKWNRLSPQQKQNLYQFLKSL